MQPAKPGLVSSQVRHWAPLGDGLDKLASEMQDAQTSGDEQIPQLDTLQLMHVFDIVNWNPNLQTRQDATPQI